MPGGAAVAHTGLNLGGPSRVAEDTMISVPLPAAESLARYELRFQSLFHAGRALSFPCDRQGEVQWDAMTDGARASFLRAQGSIGREWASPAVQLTDLH